MGRVHLVLDDTLVYLAREKLKIIRGNDNLSQFVNEFLEDFVLGENAGKDPAREAARELAQKRRKELGEQRRIFVDNELKLQLADQARLARSMKIREVSKKILLRHPNFEEYFPENDLHGDHTDRLQDIIDQITVVAGYRPLMEELKEVWQEVRS